MDNKYVVFQEDNEHFQEFLEKAKVKAEENLTDMERHFGISNLDDLVKTKKYSVDAYDIEHDFLDRKLDKSKEIKAILNNDMYKGTRELVHDVYNTLYRFEPTVNSKQVMKKEFETNNEILRQLLDNEQFETTKRLSTGNYLNSLMGTEKLSQIAYEILLEMEYQNKQMFDNINQQMQNANDIEGLKSMLDSMNNLPQTLKDQYQDKIQQTQQDLNNLQNQQQQLQQNLPQNQVQDAIQNAMNSSGATQQLEHLNQDLQDMDNAMNALGLSNKGESGEHNYNADINTVKNIFKMLKDKPKIKEIMKYVGRLRESAITEQKKKSKYFGQTPVDVTTGNDIVKVLPSSKMHLVNEQTKPIFYKNYAEKKLLQYETINDNEKTKGPIVVCMDASGSMAGESEYWAKGMVAAALEVAGMQKRNLKFLAYDSRIICSQDYIPKAEDNISKLFKVLGLSVNGSTNFDRALEACLEAVKDSRFKNSDIIFITDGCDSISDRVYKNFKTIKEEKEFKMVTIYIGGREYERLSKLSDRVHTIRDLALDSDDVNNLNQEVFSSI